MTEQFANNAITTLNGGIDNSVTTLTVTSATLFPSVSQFRIMIDSEIMLVTGVAGNIFTVTRAAEGTVAAAHLSGATVSQILTAGALNQIKTDTLASILTATTNSLSTDVTSQADPTFTTVASVTVSGSTKYLVISHVASLANGGTTIHSRIQTDNVTINGQGSYSTSYTSAGGAVECAPIFIASGLSTGSHTFSLQVAHGGASFTIHAATNPVFENASIIAIPIN